MAAASTTCDESNGRLSALFVAGLVSAAVALDYKAKKKPKCCGIAGVVGMSNPQHDARCVFLSVATRMESNISLTILMPICQRIFVRGSHSVEEPRV